MKNHIGLRTNIAILLACGLFILLGALLITYAGIQNDEAIFANPLYQPANPDLGIQMFHRIVPLMISDHIGTLKSLLYWRLFKIVRPSVFSVRLPMVLAGGLTIWVFFKFVQRVCGTKTAIYGSLLLASDPSFLLTNTFDWGPVALEHLLFVSSCLLMVRFAQLKNRPDLAGAFFLLGLALWNRADFVWALCGLGVAGVVVFFSDIRLALDRRNVAIAVIAFSAGSLPLLAYNVYRPNATLGANVRLEWDKFGSKFIQVDRTLNGSDLFGYLVSEDWAERPKVPDTPPGRIALWIRNHLGEHRRSAMAWSLLAAFLAVPLWWRSRVAKVSAIYMMVTWISMAATRGGGGSSHHVVMLWPFPQLFLAIAIGSLRWAWAATGTLILVVTFNCLVVNQYLLQFARDGAAVDFTDALYSLSESIVDTPGRTICVTDWGMFNTLTLLHRGGVRMYLIDNLFLKEALSSDEERVLARILSDPTALFAGHARGYEAFPGIQQRIAMVIAGHGYRMRTTRLVFDSNGRAVFELSQALRVN